EHEVQNRGKGAALEEGKSVENDVVNLERRVGLLSGVALIVGTMIGSGIFVSPIGVLRRTESVGLSLIIWLACGILSLMGGLCYAELGTLVTGSGSEWAYFMEGFASKKSTYRWYKPIPAFLYAWVSVLLLKPSSLAIICLTCSEYFVRVFYTGSSDIVIPNIYAVKACTCFFIIVITFINCYSVKWATKVQNIFTAAKLVAVIVIIIGGLVKLIQGNTEHLATGFAGSTTDFGNIAKAFYSGLWAYDGWNNLNFVTEELKKPHINLPRSIMIGIPLVTVCYLLVNVSYFTVMSPAELIDPDFADPVAVLFGSRLMGITGEIIMIMSVVFSTFGSANGSCFTGGRLVFVAAREGHMIDALSMVHAKKLTPSPALIFNALIALLMIIPGNIGSLIDFFSFTAWIFYGSAMGALLLMRYTKRDDNRPYKVPIIIPIIVLLVSVYLVIGPIIDDPQIEFLYASLFILAGLFFYFPFVHFKKTVPGMDKVTTLIQDILGVVPTEVMPDT
ncbi:unnamed protein product, partial [Meganyctiphanes norvegica]